MYYFCIYTFQHKKRMEMTLYKRIIISLSSIALLTCINAEAQSQIKEDTKKRAFESEFIQTVATYQAGDFTEAGKKFKAATRIYPDYDAAWYYLALCELNSGNIKESQKAFKKAAELDPQNYWYRSMLAISYSFDGPEDVTINTYEKLLKDFPKKSELYYTLTNLYLRSGQYDKAIKKMDEIENERGKDELVTKTKYKIYLSQNKIEEALKTLEDYNKEFSSPEILSLTGDHQLSQYKDSLALSYYDEALSIESDYLPALLGKADIYRIRRNYDLFFKTIRLFLSNKMASPQTKTQYLATLLQKSEQGFVSIFKPQIDTLMNTCLYNHPQDSTVLKLTGEYYYGTGRTAEGKFLFRTNATLYPESKLARAIYINTLCMEKNWEEALKESKKAFETFPTETAFIELQNMALYNQKQYTEVIKNCEKIISIAGKDTSRTIPALSVIADMYHLTGDDKATFKTYEKLLKINPNHIPSLNNYAYYLSVKKKNLNKAYAMSKKTVEKEPDNPTYLDTFGWILYLQGKYTEAKQCFKHAMIYGAKESATILDHYAEVLYALREYDLANVYWNQAKTKNNGEIPDLDKKIQDRLNNIKQ